MNPWTIIGWALIIVVVAVILFKVIIPIITITVKVIRTRNVAPKAGQLWEQATSNRINEVTNVSDDFVHVHSYTRGNRNRAYAAFGVKRAEWKAHLTGNLLYLPKDAQ